MTNLLAILNSDIAFFKAIWQKVDIDPKQTTFGLLKINQIISGTIDGFLYQIQQNYSPINTNRDKIDISCAQTVKPKKNGLSPSFICAQILNSSGINY